MGLRRRGVRCRWVTNDSDADMRIPEPVTQRFARNHPRSRPVGGEHLLQLRQMQMGAKGISEIPLLEPVEALRDPPAREIRAANGAYPNSHYLVPI